MTDISSSSSSAAPAASNPTKRVKLTGRAFYESIGSPRMIVAPMVDRSEFAWRLLTRSYLPQDQQTSLLAYTPMLHARLFHEQQHFRSSHFQPTREPLETSTPPSNPPPAYLDGNPAIDRPLTVQFCANNPEDFLAAARYVAPYCDAVDLNLGCPQGIAKSGHYGAFMQEDWPLIHSLIRKLRDELDVPVTAKIRILETKERTLEYARMVIDAGASILTVHGRRREQKGHNMGVADWGYIRYLREELPREVVMFANGNVLAHGDVEKCLEETGVDGVMSAEGNLSDPTIFAPPPERGSEVERREYWWDKDGVKGGYRIDGVFRRYMDIIHRHVLEKEPPERPPLFIPGDNKPTTASSEKPLMTPPDSGSEPAAKRQKTSHEETQPKYKVSKKKDKAHSHAANNANLKPMQGHLFQLLRPLLSTHTHIRDALARTRAGDIEGFEAILAMVEKVCAEGIHLDWEERQQQSTNDAEEKNGDDGEEQPQPTTKEIYMRPFWVCQPYIRPLPHEAIQSGAMMLSKKEKARREMEDNLAQKTQDHVQQKQKSEEHNKDENSSLKTSEVEVNEELAAKRISEDPGEELPPKEALICGETCSAKAEARRTGHKKDSSLKALERAVNDPWVAQESAEDSRKELSPQ